MSASEPVPRSRLLTAVAVVILLAAGLVWWRSRPPSADGERDAAASPAKQAAAIVKSELRAKGTLDVTKLERARITGTVRDRQSKAPIQDAQVCAMGSSRDLGRDILKTPACSRTDADGHYAIEGLLPVAYGVSATAAGHRPETWSPHGYAKEREKQIWLAAGESRENVDIMLKDGGVRIAGFTKDLSGGVVEGAWVTGGGAWGMTDANGAFELWVAPHTSWVRAHAEGYADGHRRTAAPTEGLEVFVTPEAVLVGKVVRAGTNEGVGGVKVGVRYTWSDMSDTVSEPDGSFRVSGLEAGRYQVRAWSDDLFGTSDQEVPLGLAEISQPITVEVHPAVALEAEVTVAGDKGPCPEGRVQLKQLGGERSFSGTVREDDVGHTTVQGITPGTYRVTVHCDGYVSEPDYGQLEVGGDAIPPARYEVREGLAIRGMVRYDGGEPVDRALIRIAAKRTEGEPPPPQVTNRGVRSHADGTFEAQGLLPGTYEVMTRGGTESPGMEEPIIVELESGADRNDVELLLPATGTIKGVVMDERGQTLRDVTVRAEEQGKFTWASGGNGMTVTDQDGRFEIAQISAGEYRVSASRGYVNNLRKPGTSDDDPKGQLVAVAADTEVEVELRVVATDGEITGRVVSEGGPVADAFINFDRMSESNAANEKRERASVRWGQWGERPILTDADGRFTVTGLTDGRYVVQATRKGGGEGVISDVEVGADVTIEIEATGSVRGTVRAKAGELPPNLSVTLSEKEKNLHFSEDTYRNEGAFAFEAIPAGHYELRATTDNGSARTEIDLGVGEDKSGVDLDLITFIDVTGRLVDLDTGKPVPNMNVGVPESGGFSFGGTPEAGYLTDTSGRFEIKRVPAGKATLMFFPRSWGGSMPDYQFHREHLRLEEAPSSQDIGDVKIVKNRVSDKDDVGDLGFTIKNNDPDIEPEDMRFVVAVVRPGGPAAKAGLKVGSEITSVDGHDVVGKDIRYYLLTAVPVGTTVDLGLADGNEVSVTSGPKP